MSFFKKVINGLFNSSKGKNEEYSKIKEAPLAYWEEFSHMLALVPNNYSPTEDIFENIKAIDGIEIKEKVFQVKIILDRLFYHIKELILM